MTDPVFVAQQMNRAFQLFAQNLKLDDSQAMEIADLYPAWEVNRSYKQNDIVKYGKNADQETQLYTVLQDHTSAAQWTPDTAVSLYKKIGFDPSGIPIWTQPLGATDAYKMGDRVKHKDQVWKSTIDNNVWEPGVYGWEAEDE